MKSYLKTKDFSVSQEEFELLFDEEKQLLITHPTPQNLEKYYDSEAYISHTDSNKTFVDQLYQKVKRYSLNKKVRLIDSFGNEEKSLLDVGSGTGDFLQTASKKKWTIEGVEPNPKARANSAGKGIVVHETLSGLKEKKFQVITLWHVLEHLPDLEETIATLKRLLEDDGTLIIAVPNFKSFDAGYYKKYWAAFDVPRHLWHFSKNSIQMIFLTHGFCLKQIKPMWFDAFYVSILSEKYRQSHFAFVKGMLVGFWSNLQAVFSKECSSQIYILQKEEKRI